MRALVGTCAGAELRWNTFQHLHLNKKMSYGPPAPHQHRQHRATWKIIIINRLSAVTLPCPILSRLFMLHVIYMLHTQERTHGKKRPRGIFDNLRFKEVCHCLQELTELNTAPSPGRGPDSSVCPSVPGKQRCRCDRIVPISHNPARLQMVARRPGDIGTNGPPYALTSRAHNKPSAKFL